MRDGKIIIPVKENPKPKEPAIPFTGKMATLFRIIVVLYTTVIPAFGGVLFGVNLYVFNLSHMIFAVGCMLIPIFIRFRFDKEGFKIL